MVDLFKLAIANNLVTCLTAIAYTSAIMHLCLSSVAMALKERLSRSIIDFLC